MVRTIERFPFIIEVPSQSVRVQIDDEDRFKSFCQEETAFFQQLSELLAQNIVVGQVNYGSAQIQTIAERTWTTIQSSGSKKQDFDPLLTLLEQADRLEVLMAHGRLADTARAMIGRQDKEGARWLVYICCSGWTLNAQPEKILSAFRAALFASPSNYSFGDLISSANALREAEVTKNSIGKAKDELEAFITAKTELFDQLEDVYRNKLTVEEPAISWEKIASRKTTVWMIWLAVFAALVIAPIFVAVYNWQSLSEAVTKITAPPGNGSISFAGLAIVTIPGLLYGWLLKNVSRIFIQNLNLANDAAHRRSLALTYMGLLQNEQHPASDQDRAIILNALFRPIPPQTADEGPPAGVIDLIRK